MFCQKCGKQLYKGVRFCTECGASVEDSTPDTTQNLQPEEITNKSVEKPVVEEKVQPTAEPEPVVEEKVQPTAEPKPVAEEPIGDVSEFSTADIDDGLSSVAISDAVPENEYVNDVENGADAIDAVADVETQAIKVSGGRKFGAALIIPLVIIFLFALNTLVAVRFSLNGKSVSKSVNEINIGVVLDAEVEENENVLQYVYSHIDDKFIEKHNIEEKDLRSFIEKSNVKAFTSELSENYANMVIAGKGKASLTAEDVSQFLRDNSALIESEFGYTMKDKDYSDIEKQFDELDVSKKFIPSNWESEFGFDLRDTYMLIYAGMGTFAVIVVFLMIWIAFILRKKGSLVAGYFGTIFLVAGIITLLPVVGLAYAAASTGNVALYVAGSLLMMSTRLFAIIGGVELLIGIILRVVRSKTKRSEK